MYGPLAQKPNPHNGVHQACKVIQDPVSCLYVTHHSVHSAAVVLATAHTWSVAFTYVLQGFTCRLQLMEV